MFAQKKKNRVALPNRQAEELFLEGCKQELLENYEKALYYMDKALEADPENAAIHYKLAEVRVKQNLLPEAGQSIGRALELDKSNKYFHGLAGEIALRQGNVQQAVKIYQGAIKQFPDAFEFYPPLAASYLAQRKYDDALKVYDKALKAFGFNEEIVRQKQQVLLRENKLSEALKESQLLVEQFPDEPGYVLMLAELLLSNDRVAEARSYLEKNKEALQSLPNYQIMLYELDAKEGKQDKALEHLEKAFLQTDLALEEKIRIIGTYFNRKISATDSILVGKLLNAIVQTHSADARAYCLKGDFLASRGDLGPARSLYLASLKYDQSKFNVWEQIVKIDLDMNQNDSLVLHTERALEIFPNSGVFWFYNGIGNSLTRRNRKAISSLERARKLSNSNPVLMKDCYTWLGDLYHSEKDFEKSDDAYGAALAQDSLNAHVLNNWSYFLSERNEKLTLADRLGRKLISLYPDDPTYLDTYGWILYKMGKYPEALPYLEKAAKAKEASGVVLEHYGDALFRSGNKSLAIDYWKKASRAGGDVTPELERKIQTGGMAANER